VPGFSSGGHLSAAISTYFAKRFYPGHLSLSAAEWDAKQGTKKFVVHHPTAADKIHSFPGPLDPESRFRSTDDQ
jgi:hypothetical protein